MKRLGLCVILCACALAGLSFGQDAPEPLFVFQRQIGQQRPSGIQYDANFDRFVWVDLNGQLVLVDAATYTVQHVLYANGVYNAYTFSHDGRHLALAIDKRIELWDTRTGTLAATFEPAGALQANGPLYFTPDDGLLLINTLVPAPPELRRSENDTSNLPWLWDVAAELREAPRSLPRRAEFMPFFDYRNGLVIGPNRTLIGGYPSRLTVIDGNSADFSVVAEIQSSRLERDPIYVWQSAVDDFIYVDPRLNTFVQVDAQTHTPVDLPLGRSLGFQSAEQLALPVQFSRVAQTIGEPNHIHPNSLARLIYGDNYTNGDVPVTVMLLDILTPLTVERNQIALLTYFYSERDERGEMEIIRLNDVTHVVLYPDGERLIVRRASGFQQVEIYDIGSGVLERTIVPAEPDDGQHIFALSADGKTLVTDFQRFDLATGEVTAQVVDYTRGANEIYFSDDSRGIITIRGSEWKLWDVHSGQPLQTAQINIRGNVLRRSADASRYLTQYVSTSVVQSQFEVFSSPEVQFADGNTQIVPPTVEFANGAVEITGSTVEIIGGDTDGDGVSDWVELDVCNTDPKNPDTDADGIPNNQDCDAEIADFSELTITGPTFEERIHLEIYDVPTNDRRVATLPNLPNRRVNNIVPRSDWQQFLVSYSSTNGDPDGDVAVYDFDGNRLTYIAGDELPNPNDREMGWIDDYSIYVASREPNLPSPRDYGLDYHPSGVPACLVEAYPADWEMWIGVWDNLNVRLESRQLNNLTRRVCTKLPAQAADLVPGLTPTPRFVYSADEVRIQPGVPDVPDCLTQMFPSQQLQYAELWRQLSEGLTGEEIDELETLLCEGLITSLGQIQPTPTVNPNLLFAATATPIADAPDTVAVRELGLGVVTIDIATSQRQFGTYIPDIQREPQPNLGLLYNLFNAQFRASPNQMALSPDGTLVAVINSRGFVEIFRLTKSYDELVAEEADAVATRAAERPRDIGLPPTPTPAFVSIGGPQPTITPTITPTIPVPLTVEIEPVIKDVCPARALYSLDNLPPEYAASGRIFTSSPTGLNIMWVLEPESGLWRAVDGIPLCGIRVNCEFSADRAWVLLRSEDGVTVSRPDGGEATQLFRSSAEELDVRSVGFVNAHTIEYVIQAWLPEKYSHQVDLVGRFDSATGAQTELSEREREEIAIGDLPTTVVSRQPLEGPLRLVSTPHRTRSGNSGNRYYIFDTTDGTYEYFARVDSGGLDHQWHPLGTALYYRRPDARGMFVYDTAARTHVHLNGEIPNGERSDDRRYVAYWLGQNRETYGRRLEAGDLPLKLAVWDSQTYITRRYCIPETGSAGLGSKLTWSPDGRYLLFQIQLPAGADSFPTPVGEETPIPTTTPVPLDVQYDLQFPRTVVLDTLTGYVTVLSKEIGGLLLWTEDAP